ncbi:UDP-glucose 4-epimerase GalE [Ureibacillus aquaedulcis]|uniref:UDP-glucose 4-epimerase n=1 Tax=Ureibacillus aquaedulcis TaxID=3058421 RepID=A0ABT8GW17_9BACL|nr:UDP-glucose 4-epimerase GalE [Ureibacillus sp. BA0131]MDN4495101.1 UDP-glucose 4-epimerase GalE [Ureibacillus sp. BA0131]
MILIVGGAGYIGSHLVKELVKREEVIVLDNLSTGHLEAVDKEALFVKGSLGDADILDSIFTRFPIKAVMHFAANSLVGESVVNPQKYYINNVASTLSLLSIMLKHNVNKFIFSSTAAVYGIPGEDLINESTATNPITPYGKSKLMMEQILADYSRAYDLHYVILRYFNAAGACETAEIGESHQPETHLIPIVLQHLLGMNERITIFGDNYNTTDGTCIRDYIHVSDLVDAHLLALDSLLNEKNKSATYNVGNGIGFSVKEVIETSEAITGRTANLVIEDRREGDPACLVASSEKIMKELGWQPRKNLEHILESAWRWHRNQNY